MAPLSGDRPAQERLIFNPFLIPQRDTENTDEFRLASPVVDSIRVWITSRPASRGASSQNLNRSSTPAGVAESADALDSKSSGSKSRVGSSPTSGTETRTA